ncbi:MAG: transposase [Nitrospira sp.]|nr:transposase [Nitrospira sp.]
MLPHAAFARGPAGRIREHFPEEHISENRPGHKPVPTRDALEAVSWILNTGTQWQTLPQCYPNYKTVRKAVAISSSKHILFFMPTFLNLDHLVANECK